MHENILAENAPNPIPAAVSEQSSVRNFTTKPGWDMAFLGIAAYLVIEYTRLPAMFPLIRPFQVGKLAVLLGLAGYLMSEKQSENPHHKSSGIDSPLFFFLGACTISFAFSQYPDVAGSALVDALQWGLLYFLISRVVGSAWRLRTFVILFVLLNLKLAQFGIRSYIHSRESGMSEKLMAKFGVGAGSTGFFGNAGDFGVAMGVILPLAGALIFGEEKKWAKLLFFGGWLTFLGAVVACSSRGALVAAAVTSVVTIFRSSARKAGFVLIGLFLVVGIFFLPKANLERLQRGTDVKRDGTASLRLRLWEAGIDMFEHHPVFGVGIGNYQSYFRDNYSDKLGIPAFVPHSIYIQSLSELGILGTIPFLGLLFGCFRMNGRSRKKLLQDGGSKTSFEYRLANGLDLALLGFMISGAFITVLYYPHLWLILGMTKALNISCMRSAPLTSEVSPKLSGHSEIRSAMAY